MSQTATQRFALSGYETIRALDQGGMGEVLLARRRGAHGFERLVAIKKIRTDLRRNEKLVAMFLDEARLTARLHHPNIAQVYDFGEEDGVLCLVMEYVAGRSFTELGRILPPPGICARAVAEACRGLHAAHQLTDDAGVALEVVHRDVSPGNLMMTFDGRVKILDFGIAFMRRRQAPETEIGALKGKPPYMAPEQLAGGAIDRRVDVFSAAAVLWELLAGERLFGGDSPFEVARAIEHGEIRPPSAVAGALPDGLDEVVLRGLARDPEERFQSAEALANALDRVAARAGSESLEEFAARELGAARDEHRAWLREALSKLDGGEKRKVGRASGVLTAVGDGDDEPAASAELPTTPARPGALPAIAPAEGPGAAPPASHPATAVVGRRRRGRALAYTLAGATFAAAGLLVAERLSKSGPETVAAAPAPHPGEMLGKAALDEPTELAAGGEATTAAVDDTDEAPDAEAGDPSPDPGDRSSRSNRTKVERERRKPDKPDKPDRPDKSGEPRERTADADAVREPKPVEHGTLTIGADPYALVQVDGVALGSTPVTRRFAAGDYEVVFVSPDTGEIRARRKVRVEPNRTATVILK
jgi:eukaryotic-like serine/threonine-protein kinase